ncbi:glycosyltransferase family A protein, partial [Acinetobacter baumannii]
VLNSVKEQTLRCNYEVLVVNDGSKDNSKDIVEQYISENKDFNVILIDKPNGGVSTARNAGLSQSKGDLIAFLDSDDKWFPNKLEKQLNLLNEYTEIDLLG